MTRTTEDAAFATMVQTFLQAEGLYEGAIDGAWGPVSDTAYQVYANYERYAGVDKLVTRLSADQQADLAKFLKNWKSDNLARYRAVANAADVPIELVAALHWRESGGDFTCYLQNGDPMRDAAGNPIPTTSVPAGLLFTSWITAAINAIGREKTAREMSGIEEWATGPEALPCLCIFAEYFNGEGYREMGVPDPYVLAGTSGYTAGKYTADGVYDPAAVDEQLGVLVLLRAISCGGQ
jgi:lysozyme family protein